MGERANGSAQPRLAHSSGQRNSLLHKGAAKAARSHFAHRFELILHLKHPLIITAMPFDFTPHKYVLTQAMAIHGRVLGKDGLMYRPRLGTKAVAARLKTGLRALAAFLRRILILMALQMEPDLVHIQRPEPLPRRKGKKVFRVPGFRFQIYMTEHYGPLPDFFDPSPWDVPRYKAQIVRQHHTEVPLAALFHQLDQLCAIAKDPLAKARRLAFALARSKRGLLFPPPDNNVTMRRWGLEPSALYDAMGFKINENSRTRPPPLPPVRRGPKPSITRL